MPNVQMMNGAIHLHASMRLPAVRPEGSFLAFFSFIIENSTFSIFPRNGKAEALIKTIKRECLKRLDISSLDEIELQNQLSLYSDYYNWYRLHSGISYTVPSSRYCGVCLKQTLRAVYSLEDIALGEIEVPGDVPQIDAEFIHQHTALVSV